MEKPSQNQNLKSVRQILANDKSPEGATKNEVSDHLKEEQLFSNTNKRR